jgi:serine/threonine protein phosphatase PrpC
VDLHVVPQLTPGEALMACSDGVWHYFKNEEMGATLSGSSPREASEFLIGKARTRARGMGDNLSLVIVKLEPLQ